MLFRYLIDNAGRFKLLLELTKVTRECLGNDEEAVAASFIIVQRVDTQVRKLSSPFGACYLVMALCPLFDCYSFSEGFKRTQFLPLCTQDYCRVLA